MRRQRNTHRVRTRSARRGSLYLVVLGTTMIVAVTALAAMSASRVELHAAVRGFDSRDARLRARSSIEHAVSWINANDNWRTLLENNTAQDEVTLGVGRFSWRVVDQDGSLTDDRRDHATIVGEGRVGDSIAVEQVSIEPDGRALTCLEANIHATTSISVSGSARVSGSGLIVASDMISSSNGTIDLDCEADMITGNTYNGATLESVPPREAPGEHVFDYYEMRGTVINMSDLPPFADCRLITLTMLSSTSNPYGDLNPLGIYVIDCEGQCLVITDASVNGTLVVLNADAGVIVRGTADLSPTAQNHPSLLVQGDVRFGSTDGFTALFDNLSASGIVYVTGTTTVTSDLGFGGSLISGGVEVYDGADLQVTQTTYSLDYPPPGFTAGNDVRILPASWSRTGR